MRRFLFLVLGCITSLCACDVSSPRIIEQIPTEITNKIPLPSFTSTNIVKPTNSPTRTAIPPVVLQSPFNSNCTPFIIADGAYNGPSPQEGYDSGMAPGGSGDHYEGHSDYGIHFGVEDCQDKSVYSPASGELQWINEELAFLILNKNSELQIAPNLPENLANSLKKNFVNNPEPIIIRIGHVINKVHDDGLIKAGEKIGEMYLSFSNIKIHYMIDRGGLSWSPSNFLWVGGQPLCDFDYNHCDKKTNNYYKP
jgi:hypothetical protein